MYTSLRAISNKCIRAYFLRSYSALCCTHYMTVKSIKMLGVMQSSHYMLHHVHILTLKHTHARMQPPPPPTQMFSSCRRCYAVYITDVADVDISLELLGNRTKMSDSQPTKTASQCSSIVKTNTQSHTRTC